MRSTAIPSHPDRVIPFLFSESLLASQEADIVNKAIAADRATPQHLFFSKIFYMPGATTGIDSVPFTQIPEAIEFVGDYLGRSFPALVGGFGNQSTASVKSGVFFSARIEPGT